MTNPRVVLDSNVIISSLLFTNGKASKIINLWKKHYFDLITSTHILSEVKKVLIDKQLAKKYRFNPVKQARLLSQLTHFSTIVEVKKPILLGRDENDIPILSAAVRGNADYLVTGDQDLLVLAKSKLVTPLKILTPTDFLQEFMSSEEILEECLENLERS